MSTRKDTDVSKERRIFRIKQSQEVLEYRRRHIPEDLNLSPVQLSKHNSMYFHFLSVLSFTVPV